ncbi:MAG: undecaprenyldiphospho-muramoylpentapeptide beta-N-acetylglucosaminyltransferase [candidate division Zixibacteria bacterium]|nr:undecaprenyldiphospho-muramoylpentapeptide beta-N-acetylglucosaminyltransferase [candidate division Zixibacteria bacterium]
MQGYYLVIDIIFAAGGTGGHIFPALAIAGRLTNANVSIAFVGRKNSMEEKLYREYGYRMETIKAVKMRRSFTGIFGFIFAYPFTVLNCYRLLGKLKPAVVLASGGFVSGPVGTAAYMRGIPLILQEQNSLPGLSSKLLNLMASVTYTAYPEAGSRFMRKESVEMVGNPVRKFIGGLSREEGCSVIGCDPSRKNVLIIGGSQGAQSINRAMEELIGTFPSDFKDAGLIWQCGRGEDVRLKKLCGRKNINAVVKDFFGRMDAVYAAADIAVCRAGALTLSELSQCGIPMIMIPYPYATADHQSSNARYFQQMGAGIMIKDSPEMGELIREALLNLLDSDDLRGRMSSAGQRMVKEDPAEIIAGKLLEYVEKK